MRLRILPATVDRTPGQSLSGYLVDDAIAIDAGPLGFAGGMAEQERIQHVFLTHSHIDHIAGLPMFLDNRYGCQGDCPTVYGHPGTLESLQTDLFNGRLMPDFIGMSRRMTPFLNLQEVEPGESLRIEKYTITPMSVDHGIPALGYVVDDGDAAFGLLTDTKPIPDVVHSLCGHPRMRAIFLECSFPRRMQLLAATSYHHSTDDFLIAARKVPHGISVYPIHIKPRYRDEILAELTEANRTNVRFVEPGESVGIG